VESDVKHPPDESNQRQFVELFLANQRRVMTYIATLLCSPPDVEDVFQEVSIVMWQKFASFQPGTSFPAWACHIAYLKVLEFRRRQKRTLASFSDELLESLAIECEAASQDHQRQHEQVGQCIAELGRPQRRLLQIRFAEKATLKSTAETVGLAINTVRRQLNALYATLRECVDRKLAEDELR
jgi:RNA polymerase sigma-70 factor, ECF subfamily